MELSDLKPNAKNPRKITPKKLKQLEKALLEFGDLSALVVLPGTENRYVCSPDGFVWSVFWKRPILGSVDEDGYLKTAIRINGKRKDIKIHQLIALAFLGIKPDGHVVNHKNGIRSDNRAENLEYVLPADNERHARKVLGKRLLGEKASRSVLTELQVRDIRLMNSFGCYSIAEIAQTFKISDSQVRRIVNLKNWSHI